MADVRTAWSQAGEQLSGLGQKLKGMLVQSVRTGVESLIDAMATGSVDTLDGDDFFTLPDYGWDTTTSSD